ncbi:MAG: 50S ribosomal protein L32 [Deltaproteobacteria bacterium]|nr:50S ribosomal protein L32 [Deltaproteobacteria bacterium]
MGVPKKRKSSMKKKMRRAHHALGKTNLIPCSDCGEPTLPHRVCPNCHRYRGKRIAAVAED